jgi:hypothetical protein
VHECMHVGFVALMVGEGAADEPEPLTLMRLMFTGRISNLPSLRRRPAVLKGKTQHQNPTCTCTCIQVVHEVGD